MKRVGIFTWILGWGVYSNAKNIAKIKENLHILQKQNQLQDKQIKQLVNFLNLTMHQVDRHSEMLYELDTKMTIINKTIQELMWNIDVIRYEMNLMYFFPKQAIQSIFFFVCFTIQYRIIIRIYESRSFTRTKPHDYSP